MAASVPMPSPGQKKNNKQHKDLKQNTELVGSQVGINIYSSDWHLGYCAEPSGPCPPGRMRHLKPLSHQTHSRLQASNPLQQDLEIFRDTNEFSDALSLFFSDSKYHAAMPLREERVGDESIRDASLTLEAAAAAAVPGIRASHSRTPRCAVKRDD